MRRKGKSTRITKITIRNLTKRAIPKVKSIKGIAKKVLDLEKSPDFGLSITYVNDQYIRRLNQKYIGKDSPTDVLAFSAREGKRIKGDDKFLGDVVISLDAAERQAKHFRSTKDKELKLYLIHGILHLLGYDDRKKSDAQKMAKRQEKLMGTLL